MRRFIAVLAALLVAILAPRAYAQSNVLSQEDRALFAQMDASLHGYWEGHGDGDGMKYDPQAIACMVNKCSLLHVARSSVEQLRDSANFGSCYDAHLARIKKSGYTRLTNPPPISVLGCNLIAAQANSTDDRVYEAVNGQPRNRPQPPVVVRVARRGIAPTDSERAFLHAQMMKDDNPYKDEKQAPKPSSARSKSNVVRPPVAIVAKPANDNPYLDAPAPVAAKPTKARASGGSSAVKMYGDLGDKLVLVSADETQAKIYVRPGGQFYTVRASYLAEKYDVDWKNVFLANQYADTIGACWSGNKVALDPDRMKAKSYDKAKLEGPVDAKFLEACEGEFNFALQAGQTIVLAAKAITPTGQPPAQEPSPPPANQAQTQAPPEPEPTAEAPPIVSAPPVENSMPPTTVNEPPPAPSGSAAINVTVQGKPRGTLSSLKNDWFLILLVILVVVLLVIGITKRRKRQTSHWGAGPDEPTLVGKTKPPPSGPGP